MCWPHANKLGNNTFPILWSLVEGFEEEEQALVKAVYTFLSEHGIINFGILEGEPDPGKKNTSPHVCQTSKTRLDNKMNVTKKPSRSVLYLQSWQRS